MIDRKYTNLIGIDCGVNTGYAEWFRPEKYLFDIRSCPIHIAMNWVWLSFTEHPEKVFVRVEDARLRTWFGKSGPEVWKGAGSICRDSKIWEDYLTWYNIPFELVAPKNNKTKVSHEYFTKLTGYGKPTNQHGRDAAMLVFGF